VGGFEEPVPAEEHGLLLGWFQEYMLSLGKHRVRGAYVSRAPIVQLCIHDTTHTLATFVLSQLLLLCTGYHCRF
jgi:hypothetical protein